jgi:hypothetical protein
VQHDEALLEAVEQAAGRADDHLTALPQLHALLGHGRAADDGDAAHARMRRELAALRLDLLRQLARRRHDERERAELGAARAHGRRLRQHVLQQGDEEGGRLAAARLGDADEVASRQAHRKRGALDRARLLVAHVGDGAPNVRVKPALVPRAQRVEHAGGRRRQGGGGGGR